MPLCSLYQTKFVKEYCDCPTGSIDRPAGAGSKASPQGAGTEDFEPFFKDMFL